MNTQFVPRIEKPCPASWDEMRGDDKRRFCEHCQLHVHNLTATTFEEQKSVLEPVNERKCVSYIATQSAKPVDARMWIRLQSMTGWHRAVAAMLAAAFSLFSTSCRTTGTPMPPSDTSPRKMGKMQVKAVPDTKPVIEMESGKQRLMGSPVVPPPAPWWKKMLFLD